MPARFLQHHSVILIDIQSVDEEVSAFCLTLRENTFLVSQAVVITMRHDRQHFQGVAMKLRYFGQGVIAFVLAIMLVGCGGSDSAADGDQGAVRYYSTLFFQQNQLLALMSFDGGLMFLCSMWRQPISVSRPRCNPDQTAFHCKVNAA
ncbi:MAG: hypothetical protein AB3X44_21320 [Leptothrix sp. (in: b-proteobacteria)]